MISERIKSERKRLNLNQLEFAKSCGVGLRSQSNYEKGERNPDAVYLRKAAGLGADVNYIITGERKTPPAASFSTVFENPIGGKMEDLRLQLNDVETNGFDANNYVHIPLFDVQVSAGAGAFVSEENILTHLTFTKYSLRKKGFDAHNLMCVTVAGDSMMNTLEPHETVMIDTTKRQIDGGIFVIRVGESVHIKRLIQEKDSIRVISDNTKYPEWTLDKTDDFEIIGQKIWQAKWS